MDSIKNSLVALLMIVCVQFTNAQSGKKNEKAVIQTQIFCDHCTECETCGKKFQDEILDITGVKMYELDAEKNTITVYYNGKKTSLSNIKQGISKLGYDADDIKADSEAYAKLDGCCKKI